MSMKEIAAHYGVGETVVHKRIHEAGIKAKAHGDRRGRGFSAEHRVSLSKAQKGKSYPERRTGFYRPCKQCGKEMWVKPARTQVHWYCSYACKGAARRKETGTKFCTYCGKAFKRRANEGVAIFEKRPFCSVACNTALNPPPTFEGEEHPLWKGDEARRKQPRGKQGTWRKAVLKRDNYTCQDCGVTGETVLLVAHHIKPWEDSLELRYDVDNGLTLCEPCHFKAHGYDVSGKDVIELRDERGVLMRRVYAKCAWCGKPIVKQASDMKRSDGSLKPNVYCGYSCAGKGNQKQRKLMKAHGHEGHEA
jgi:endogenous inhibitor of DNA gyrase (YacG/DUF329 family)